MSILCFNCGRQTVPRSPGAQNFKCTKRKPRYCFYMSHIYRSEEHVVGSYISIGSTSYVKHVCGLFNDYGVALIDDVDEGANGGPS
jgi:hypothetical protein